MRLILVWFRGYAGVANAPDEESGDSPEHDQDRPAKHQHARGRGVHAANYERCGASGQRARAGKRDMIDPDLPTPHL
jgi:hypothetical protein